MERNDVTISEEVLTKEQVCTVLNLKPRTVEDLMRTGELRAYKVKARWVILKSDLISYIKSHKSH
jgi:excisionase family DNA binding protein